MSGIANDRATNPPKRECRQCWFHAYEIHKGNWLGLAPRKDCPECLDHLVNGHPDHMIVK
ncbi:pRL2-8 [Streptomyces platensis]|uniref:pRL2-8 n=1 Tax=Streptomyces platensis TaxID=58346 RepID=UPI003F4D4022